MIDPEFEMWLGETWRRDPHALRSDPFEAFFERREIEKSLGSMAVTQPMSDIPALNDFRDFVKSQKQKIPQMTTRDIRISAAQVLRKAADALAAI
jgi:hypothetical protein